MVELAPAPVAIASFKDVIGLWPSPAAMAGDIGAKVPAARKWAQRDRIPSEWWAPILEAAVAREAGVTGEMLARLGAKGTAEART